MSERVFNLPNVITLLRLLRCLWWRG